jgi:hypothetical protein
VITPTIAYGKGFGNFDLHGTFGVGAPTADTNIVGRNYAWNNTFQYRAFRKFWPEVELNSTFFQDGKNDGQKQNCVTPGLVMGRTRLGEESALRWAEDTRSPLRTFIPLITMPFCRFGSPSEK